MQNQDKASQKLLCVVTPYIPTLTETFIRSHIESLPAKVVNVHGWRPTVGANFVLSRPSLLGHKLLRLISGEDGTREITAAYSKVFQQYKVDAVLAEYGETGVAVYTACVAAKLPLIVHFHGYDASVRSVLEQHAKSYPQMFAAADAIIAVSNAMRNKLISLGAAPDKVYYNPYGVNCDLFGGADPRNAPPLIIAVGRFTEKKAPHLTLSAFAKVVKQRPDAKLRMIGTGPLLESSQKLAAEFRISEAVTFLGAQDHDAVQREMKAACCFVQHSVEAPSGDSEGTPVGIIEAGATGLPVVSTRHAGIVDVVIENETGLLVEEGDVEGMAVHLLTLLNNPELAGKMGEAARNRIQKNFSQKESLGRLWQIIESCIERRTDVARTLTL
jgi:glycosyltransferase involved in cell wall biosynthesis